MEIKRHELKFYINHLDYSYLTSILSNFLAIKTGTNKILVDTM